MKSFKKFVNLSSLMINLQKNEIGSSIIELGNSLSKLINLSSLTLDLTDN